MSCRFPLQGILADFTPAERPMIPRLVVRYRLSVFLLLFVLAVGFGLFVLWHDSRFLSVTIFFISIHTQQLIGHTGRCINCM